MAQPIFDAPWIEKYRPQKLEDVVGNQDVVQQLKTIIEQGNVPNMIMNGPPGCGKTTSVMALAHELLGDNFSKATLELNASDERGIDVVRERIKAFANQKVPLPEKRHKIIILDEADALAVKEIKKRISIPLVVDIHFDYRLALLAMENGADKVRINPGNIGNLENIKKVVDMAKEKHIPIRIGVNSGSLDKEVHDYSTNYTAEVLVASAKKHVEILESLGFYDIAISLKGSNIIETIAAYRLAAETFSYPLHLGITEAGYKDISLIRSTAGLAPLLLDGIGDTIRISLTDNPIEEVYAAKKLLKGLGLRNEGIKFVSCPTCGRTSIDLISLAKEAEIRLQNADKNITVAVMGCVVNGPGEAKEADIGIAGGDGCAVMFRKGEILRKIPESDIVSELLKEIEKM